MIPWDYVSNPDLLDEYIDTFLQQQPIYISNLHVINPSMNVNTELQRLASSSFNGRMGTLGENNRRTLGLWPGRYEDVQLVHNYHFVDIVGFGSPEDTILIGTDGNPCVYQQVCNVRMQGFTIAGYDGGSPSSGTRGLLVKQNSTTSATTTHLGNDFYKIEATGIGKGVSGIASDYLNSLYLKNTWIYVSGTDADGHYKSLYIAGSYPTDDTLLIYAPGMGNYTDVTVKVGEKNNIYKNMHFTTDLGTGGKGRESMAFEEIGSGQFYGVSADHFAFRNISGSIYTCCLYMDDVQCLDDCIIGDEGLDGRGIYKNINCGNNCLSGCVAFGIDHHQDSMFMDINCGQRCLALGATASGLYRNIVMDNDSLAATVSASYPGSFEGHAENIHAIGDCLGIGHADGRCKGTVINLTAESLTGTLNAEGANIKRSTLKQTTADTDCIVIKDSNCKISYCDLIANGTGKSINAGSALNVVSSRNNMNTGLGANVTNLLSTNYDITDALLV